MIESDTDTRQALVASLRRLARHIRSWDTTIAELHAGDPEAEPLREYSDGLRTAVAVAFLGTTRTDHVDQWVADLLDTAPSTRRPMPTTAELEM